jgi:hypothetical protein
VDYPNTLNTDNYSSKSQRFDDLFQEGISFIQNLSGEKWTDYNYHDPGITILEQLCFAITDLGYKSNFSIEDLLMLGVDDFDFESKNLFIPPNKIFSSNPCTFNDYRRLIIDSIDEINNVWLEIIKDNKASIKGLFDVKLQLKDNISDEVYNDVINKTKLILSENRKLCSDLNKIIILKKDTISIGANIVIDSFYVGEEILAKIFIEIERRLNDKVKTVGYEYFEDKEISVDKIFQGVETKNGIILEDNLKDKTNQVYVSEIIEIIKNIEGVINIKDFVIFKNGIKIYDEIISFSENSYPSLESIDTYFSENSESEINFIRNNTNYNIDGIIFSQIYDSNSASDNISILKNYKTKTTSKGRFSLEQLKKYYSIINEFPSIYGLRDKELNPKASKLRKAQMKQLKAYLLLFDQIMSNYTAQLANIRNVFSIESVDKTYFSEVPTDISGLEEILKPKNISEYQSNINKIIENEHTYVQRRNKFLDHLLLRFGESFNSDLLKNIYRNENPEFSEIDCELYAINCKINYLKNITKLGNERNKAENFLSKDDNKISSSGLENRIKLLLDIKDNKVETKYNFDQNNAEFKEKYIWSTVDVKIKDGPNIKVLSLPNYCYKNDKANFYLKNYTFFKDLFLNAKNEKSYKIIDDESNHILLYNSSEIIQPIKIFQSEKKVDCEKKIEDIILKIKDLNIQSEGFYLIENILLRPLNTDKFSLSVFTNNRELIFKSYKINDFIELSEMRDGLIDLLKDRSNYSIHKSYEDTNKFVISVFDVMDNKILISNESFKTKIEAQDKIEKIIQNYVIKSNLKIEINTQSSSINNFPDNFNYSNEVHVIFPEWPSRFQNIEFKKYIKEIIDNYIPANIKFNLHFLNYKDIRELSEIFSEWKELKKKNKLSKIDILSLKLIQFLSSI